jgi:hypothetical protein
MTKTLIFALTTHAEFLLELLGEIKHTDLVKYKDLLVSDAFDAGKNITIQADVALFKVETKFNITVT